MTATTPRQATWTAPSVRLRRLQDARAELSAELLPRGRPALPGAEQHRICAQLLGLDEEEIEIRAELAADAAAIAARPRREREHERSDHHHLCAEIVDQWRERARLADPGIDVPVSECFRPGRGRALPGIGAVWAAVRDQWDALREGARIVAERRTGAQGA